MEKTRYIDLTSDYGFKRVFSSEPNKDLLIDFINSLLKNMSRLDKIPLYLRKPIFQKLFEIAEYSKLNREEKEMYDISLKRKWDAQGSLTYAEQKGREEGLEKGLKKGLEKGREVEKREAALKMLEKGLAIELISDILGLSIEEIEKLK